MADVAGAAAVQGNVAGQNVEGDQQPQQQQQSAWQIVKSLATRMIILYFAMQAMAYFRHKPMPVEPSSAPGAASPGGGLSSTHMPGNIYQKGTLFDMHVYISESERFTNFADESHLYWSLRNFEYGNWNNGPNQDGVFNYNGQFPLSKTMQNNGSIYIHVYVTEAGRSPNPKDKETFSKRGTFSTFKRINKFIKKTYKTTKNLLTGSTEKDEDYQIKAKDNLVEVISHWHPNLTINLIDDHTPWQKNQVPAPLNEYIEFEAFSGKYYPILYINDYWNLNSDYQPINETLSYLNLSLTFSHLQLWKWQLYLSQTMRNQWMGMLADDNNDADQDTVKRTLIETNPYLLALTVVITLVHNVFEFLAFKNDIQFWRNKKSLEGLSVNSVLFGCFTSFIVLLYVLDNDTNTVVKISVGIGLLIDLWKVPKLVNIEIDYNRKYLGIIPHVTFIHKTSYVESKTNDYDKLAFKYLSWVLFPLVFGYAIYSLIYLEHKSWYSWFLSMIYGFLLTFGFIMMTPQLFINYKLKSVAHLPWRQMTYKALNTFIDDIFAFVIKMPTMYRLGCFRDDIIFFIYLYQRWIYPTDKKRTNEFGTSGEPDGSAAAVAEAAAVPNATTPAIAAADGQQAPVENKKDQ